MKAILFPILCLGMCACVGCARFLSTAGGSAAGALVGHTASHGSPLGTAAGAAGGALVSEGVWAWKTRAEKKSFDDGYVRGRADAVKSNYWHLQNPPAETGPRYRRLQLTIPARREGGVLYEAQTTTIIIAE